MYSSFPLHWFGCIWSLHIVKVKSISTGSDYKVNPIKNSSTFENRELRIELLLLVLHECHYPCQCTMCCLYSIFSSQPNELGHKLTPHNCDIIQHIFIPTRSVARKTLLWTFSWASNSKFPILPELYPCSNYGILAFFYPNLCLNTCLLYTSPSPRDA